jgi:phosphatidylglycerol:prolipoprotein diacylglycerol transferase
MLNYIIWNFDPILVKLGPITIHWYGLMWGLGFLIGFELMSRIFKHEKHPKEWADKMFIFMFIGTIIGARLGHCLFYEHWFDWVDTNGMLREGYISHPLNLLKIYEGGLSSHGGAFGILTAMFFYNRNVSKKGYIWIFDRLVMPVAVVGAFIRFGNLLNSEIYGEATTMPWGFIFVRDGQTLPAHPTQLYEVLYCLVSLGLTSFLYWKKKAYQRRGLIFGTFLIIIFFTRFLLEFIKNNQESFEDSMALNMGQILSIPFVLWGGWLIYNSYKKPRIED